ncbi:MAG: CsiV family protein [Stenotrophobium sp.]
MNILTRILLVLSLTLALPVAAWAESYRVDLIVFLDKGGTAGELGRTPAAPDLTRAIALTDTSALRAAGITLLPESDFALNPEWQHLKFAKRYEPVIRLSWIQKDPPADRGPALHLQWGGTDGAVIPLDGTVSLTASHYLHLDANLVYTLTTAEGTRVSYRLRENRLMRRDELHHLDSPKIGILAKVTKAGGN